MRLGRWVGMKDIVVAWRMPMPLYEVCWYEKILHSTLIQAESEELAIDNLGESNDDEWIDSEFLGIHSVREAR